MCLAIPGRLVSVDDGDGLRMGTVDFSGTRQTVCLEYVPEAEIGSYVLVHAGFAIRTLDRDDADRTLALLREMAAGDPGGDTEA
ncbi:HypC/HybG/HupF family hydrogenase formation chaperone [bacterium]|nr:HypC/HybG/HupF family hydrogenase formation chaperone [bacterium]